MQNHPLTVSSVLEYAARWHPDQEIISKTVEGPIVVSTYADLSQRAKLCAVALQRLGIRWARACSCLSAWRTFLPVSPPLCAVWCVGLQAGGRGGHAGLEHNEAPGVMVRPQAAHNAPQHGTACSAGTRRACQKQPASQPPSVSLTGHTCRTS